MLSLSPNQIRMLRYISRKVPTLRNLAECHLGTYRALLDKDLLEVDLASQRVALSAEGWQALQPYSSTAPVRVDRDAEKAYDRLLNEEQFHAPTVDAPALAALSKRSKTA